MNRLKLKRNALNCLVDLPGGHNESFAANAEDPAMGLCLGLSTSLSRHGSRRSHSLHEANNSTGSCCHHRDDLFDPPMVPYPVYPNHGRLHTGARYALFLNRICRNFDESIRNTVFCRSVDGDRDLSDSDESPPTRYRSYSQPPSRRGSMDLTGQQRPALMVRRVGSRQMLVLGDEASIHGMENRVVMALLSLVLSFCLDATSVSAK